jgi:alpha-tubulin suppressor-like RCC1 family protein
MTRSSNIHLFSALLFLLLSGCDFLKSSDSFSLIGTFSLKSTKVSVGDGHVCALSGRDIFCWGSNQYGQLGAGLDPEQTDRHHKALRVIDPNPNDPWVNFESAGDVNCAIKLSGRVFCWGANGRSQAGVSSPLETVHEEFYSVPMEIFWRRLTNTTEASLSRSFSEIGTGAELRLTLDRSGGCVYAYGRPNYYCWGLGSVLSAVAANYMYLTYQEDFVTCKSLAPTLCYYTEFSDNGVATYNLFTLPIETDLYTDAGNIYSLEKFPFTICSTYSKEENSFESLCRGEGNIYLNISTKYQKLVYVFSKKFELSHTSPAKINDPRCQQAGFPDKGVFYCSLFYLEDTEGVSTVRMASSTNHMMEDGSWSAYKGRVLPSQTFVSNSFKKVWGRSLSGVSNANISCSKNSKKSIGCTSNVTVPFSDNFLGSFNQFGSFFENLKIELFYYNEIDDVYTLGSTGGLTTFDSEVVTFDVGQGVLCASLKNNTVSCYGYNNLGQSGFDSSTKIVKHPNVVQIQR